MGIPERKAKEKEDLKALILQGAKKLFLEKGIEHTTIRNIADEVEYSVGTVYVYYKDKNAILDDLHKQGFLKLREELRVLFNVSEPMERLKALGRVYMQFALDNIDMYDLMFIKNAPMECLENREGEDWDEGVTTFGVLQTTVEQCIDKGYFKGHKIEPLSLAIWSCVHGMCSLFIRSRIQGVTSEDPEMLMKAAYEEFVTLIDKK